MKLAHLQIGSVFTHPTFGNVQVIAIGNVKVPAVYTAGTIEVRNIWTHNCYRITGIVNVKSN